MAIDELKQWESGGNVSASTWREAAYFFAEQVEELNLEIKVIRKHLRGFSSPRNVVKARDSIYHVPWREGTSLTVEDIYHAREPITPYARIFEGFEEADQRDWGFIEEARGARITPLDGWHVLTWANKRADKRREEPAQEKRPPEWGSRPHRMEPRSGAWWFCSATDLPKRK